MIEEAYCSFEKDKQNMKTKNCTPTETMRLNMEFADNGIILRNPDIEDVEVSEDV